MAKSACILAWPSCQHYTQLKDKVSGAPQVAFNQAATASPSWGHSGSMPLQRVTTPSPTLNGTVPFSGGTTNLIFRRVQSQQRWHLSTHLPWLQTRACCFCRQLLNFYENVDFVGLTDWHGWAVRPLPPGVHLYTLWFCFTDKRKLAGTLEDFESKHNFIFFKIFLHFWRAVSGTFCTGNTLIAEPPEGSRCGWAVGWETLTWIHACCFASPLCVLAS